MVEIRRITHLTAAALRPLLEASLEEGYAFIETLWEEYVSGVNPFITPGGVLLGGYEGEALVAVGGVHVDPYEEAPAVGRVRHVYVLPELRRQQIGRRLVSALIDHAAGHFATLTLRTPTAHGDAFYKSLGFTDAPRFVHATHWLDLRRG
ncbi:MAG: GNAT family N-acetyltransferase [Chloroflexi bacterium]|nr:GNAT family N-acetyltransferase [Chloroflexota bacterium]